MLRDFSRCNAEAAKSKSARQNHVLRCTLEEGVFVLEKVTTGLLAQRRGYNKLLVKNPNRVPT